MVKINKPEGNEHVFDYTIIKSLPETTEVLIPLAVTLTFERGNLPWTLGVPA